MPIVGPYEVKTGAVRLSGYAIKLRRAVNKVLKPHFGKELDAKLVNQSISDLNKKIYEIAVNRYKLPKECIVNVALKFSVEDNKVKVEDILIEVYEYASILSRNITAELKEALK